MRRILTVSTPATSADLVTLADVKLELGIAGSADDAWLQRVITSASQAARTYCNRDFVAQTYSEQLFPDREPYPWQTPDSVATIQLSRWPLIGAVTVTCGGGALVQDVDFIAVPELGHLLRRCGAEGLTTWGSSPLTVAYEAGFEDIPVDLQDGVLDLVKGRFYARKRDPGLKSESVAGVWSGEYWLGTGPGGPGDLPTYVAAKLDRYRVPVIA